MIKIRWAKIVWAGFLIMLWSAQGIKAEEGAATTTIQEVAEEVRIDQNLDAQIPLDLAFLDETGKSVRLSDFFGKTPVILNFVFFKCPMLCPVSLSGIVTALRVLKMTPGKDFEILTVSFDPADKPEIALERKKKIMEQYGRPEAAGGWHFLTGEKAAIEALTKAVGFHYMYDAKSDQFAHAGGLMIATPEGKLSRYFYGIEYAPKDLRFSLIEASQGKIGTWVDQILLLCFHYDPATGKYGVWIMGILRLLAVITLIVLGGFMWMMYRRDKNTRMMVP